MSWFTLFGLLIGLYFVYLVRRPVVTIKLAELVLPTFLCISIWLVKSCSKKAPLLNRLKDWRNILMTPLDENRIKFFLAIESSLIIRTIIASIICLVFFGLGYYLHWAAGPHEMTCGKMEPFHLNSHVSFPNSIAFYPLDLACDIFGADVPYVVVLENHSFYDENALTNSSSYDPVTNYFTVGPAFRNISKIILNYPCMKYGLTWSCLIDLPQFQDKRRNEKGNSASSRFVDEARDKRKTPTLFDFIFALIAVLVISLVMCCAVSFAVVCVVVVVMGSCVILAFKILIGV